MFLAMLFILMVVSSGFAFDELKKSHPEEYKSIGRERTLISPLSQMVLVGYFIAFEYRSIWSQISKKREAFIAASIFTWAFMGYGVWLLTQQLNT